MNTRYQHLSLKELVGPGKKVFLEKYRKGELYYVTSDGFQFTVPVEDCGDAEFLNEDKAMLFMRYIRKQQEANAQALGEALQENQREAVQSVTARFVAQ